MLIPVLPTEKEDSEHINPKMSASLGGKSVALIQESKVTLTTLPQRFRFVLLLLPALR